MRALAALFGVAVLVASTGCGGGRDDAGLPPSRVQTVTPPRPQRLAFVTNDRIGVFDGEGIRYVGRFAPGDNVLGIEWSGDGRQLAWQLVEPDNPAIGYRLEMVDVLDGSRQSWSGVSGDIDPGLRGVLVSSYLSRFTEYLPDGQRRSFSFRLPRPAEPIADVSSTSVDAAMPFHDRWLVLAEHSSTSGRGGPVRAFLLDPQTGRYDQVAQGTGYPGDPASLGQGEAIWIERRSGSACLSADELGAYRRKVSELPERADERTWEIGRLLTGQDISVLARGTGQFGYNGPDCDSDDAYTWMTLRDGAWAVRERGLLDLDLAADGRVARVRGRICREDEGCPQIGYLGLETVAATIEDPAGQVTQLPPDTTEVRFSPSRPAAAPIYGGEGPELSPGMWVEPDGFGPLAMGMTPKELQEATATPLTFDLAAGDCGTVAPTDGYRGDELGIEGEIRDGRLTEITVSTRDRPPEEDLDEDYEPDPLSDLQPDVGSVERRGPLVASGIRAGDMVDLMLERLGPPAVETSPSPIDAVDYSYDLGDATLLVHSDGSGTMRRLQMRAAPTPRC